MKTIEHNGHTINLEWHHDEDCEAPWEHECGHGPVSEWTRRDKFSGERVLCSDRGSRRYYDFAKAIKIAKRDGWGLSDKETAKLAAKLGRKATRGEIIAESVERDFELLRRWCSDDWFWCGYVVTIEGTDYHESLWGIDSDSQAEFEASAIREAQQWIDNEVTQSQDSACRDIATV
jgi:hypothetical protein